MLEPVSFTLGIFKIKVCNQVAAWRTLGYINSNKNDDISISSASHYHMMLKTILSSFKEVQDQGGLEWELTYKKYNYRVMLKFLLLMVLSDTESQDKLCGIFLYRGKYAGRV